MKTPDVPQIAPTDPRLDAEREQARLDSINASQITAQGDTASLMARYGMRLALANAMGGGGGGKPVTGPSGPSFGQRTIA